MKLEIEVKESEIKDAIERNIRAAIANKMNSYMSEEIVKKRVSEAWSDAVDKVIAERLSDLPALSELVRKRIEAKITGKLNSLMREPK